MNWEQIFQILKKSIIADPWGFASMIILGISALFVYNQLKIRDRTASAANFHKINDDLKSPEIREIRRKLFRRGDELKIRYVKKCLVDIQNILSQIEKLSRTKYKYWINLRWWWDKKILKYKIKAYHKKPKDLENNSLTSDHSEYLIKLEEFYKSEQKLFESKKKKINDFIKDNISAAHRLIIIFDSMGLIVNHGGAIKKIMLDMYWDVIIKSWDCLYFFIEEERSYRNTSVDGKEKETETVRTYFNFWIFKLWIKRIEYIFIYCWRKVFYWSKHYDFVFTLPLTRFLSANSYRNTHYENFELLVRHAEWYAWKRKIGRPLLFSIEQPPPSTQEKKYCTKCGGYLQREIENTFVRFNCKSCNSEFYLNPKPCVTAVIFKKNRKDGSVKVLLSKRAKNPGKEKWDLIGGFIENHEQPLDALTREIKEELSDNVEICKKPKPVNIGIFMDEYGEGGASTLNIAYKCSIKFKRKIDNINELKFDKEEIEDLKFFDIADLPEANEFAFKNVGEILKVFSK